MKSESVVGAEEKVSCMLCVSSYFIGKNFAGEILCRCSERKEIVSEKEGYTCKDRDFSGLFKKVDGSKCLVALKEHDDREFWTYRNTDGRPRLVYFVDGQFRSEHMTAQYLMDKYHMSMVGAYKYVREIRPC